MISGVIIAKNESRYIESCIRSLLPVVDEVIVVDSYSEDGTDEIARRLGAEVYQHPFENYGKQKNIANSYARYPWILSIDADEQLDSVLQQSILRIKPQLRYENRVVYAFKRQPWYCGRWLRYTAWNPDIKIRLFPKALAYWEETPVHEQLRFKTKVKTLLLEGRLLHYTFETLSEHLRSIDYYTSLQAQIFQQKGFQARWYHLIGKPLWEFFRSYFLKQGFRDGKAGLVLSMMLAFYKFIKYAKVYRL